MENFMIYLLKTAIGLSVVSVFYLLFLKSLTFYRWNRYFLAIAPMMALLLPLLEPGEYRPAFKVPRWISSFDPAVFPPNVPQLPMASSQEVSASPWSFTELAFLIYMAGAAFMLARFVVRCISLLRLRQRAVLIEHKPVNIYQINEPIAPFSFGHSIYVNMQGHETAELLAIIRHEAVHVREKHSLDLVWAELLCIINWFNPFVWLTRFHIRQNLEFIADRQVIKAGTNKTFYQYLLLKVKGYPVNPITINFNFSSLKKRVAMMNQLNSPGFHRFRFLLMIPVIASLILAFNVHNFPVQDQHRFVYAGIMSSPEGERLNGREIVEQTSGLSVKTDKNGYFRLSIPVSKFPINLAAVVKTKDNKIFPVDTFTINNRTIQEQAAYHFVVVSTQVGQNAEKIHVIESIKHSVNPAQNGVFDYRAVDRAYLEFRDHRSWLKTLAQSDKPVLFRNGVPVAVNRNGGTATFSEGELRNSADYKILVFGRLMSADEVNRRYKRSDFGMVGAGERTSIRDAFGIEENMLVLDTIQGNVFVNPSPLLRGRIIK